MFKKDRISISEILLVINGGPPLGIDPETAKAGVIAHRTLTNEIVNGNIPSSLVTAGLRQPVNPGKLVATEVDEHLSLSARPDLISQNMTVELKPGPDIKGRHLLQLAATCTARDIKGPGAVYLYKSQQTYVVKDGGESARPEIERMAQAARKILDIQIDLENKRRSLSPTEKFELGKESARLGRELQSTTETVTRKIKKQLVKIS